MEVTLAKKRKTKIGFIGGGGISRHHMKYLAEMDDVELVGVADVSEDALGLCSEQFGFSNCFTDYKDLLKIKDLQAVTVGTPNGMHHQPTLDALNAGKDVLVEKPMAMSPAEATEMVKAARKKKRLLVIGFQHRFSAAAQMLKRSIDDDQFGNVMYARCLALRRRGIPNWGVFGRKDLQGGGALIDIGVHMIEAAHYLMGSPQPVSAFGSSYTYIGDKPSDTVSSWPNWDYKSYNVEDLAVGMVRFDNGATLSVEASFAAHIGKDEWTFTLMGDKGGGQFNPPMIFKDESDTMVNLSPEFLPNTDEFRHKLRHFVDCVQTGNPSDAPGEHGLLVQQILNGIYESADTGHEVKIKKLV
ncbi:MAG: Gfo/Idh/MocA family oxidoreductase [Candidatus Latescibacteria bacterium]|nr:Gfo/Idh/MocA family oxidoreductase [Candidatus Latescibacterota bacterium]